VIRRAWEWIRFGRITCVIKAVDGGVVSEEAYYGRGGRLVGYWAHGYWDPSMLYRG
jgi:hypothetical protein